MDRRILRTSLVAATLFIGGTAFAQQSADQQSSTPSDSGAQTSQQRQPADTSGQASPAGAQIGQSQATAEMDVDKQFIKNAAMCNMAEMKLTQAAQDKAQSPDVKKLAQDLMQDHQKMDEKLKEVAQKTGVQLPQDLPQGMQKDIQTISQLQGDDFDKQFVSSIKAAHAASISRFGDQAKIAKNEDIKRFAAEQFPALQKHGQQVMTVASAQGLSTDNLGQAQPAGGTISPSQEQQPGTPHDSTFTPNSSSQQPKSDSSR